MSATVKAIYNTGSKGPTSATATANASVAPSVTAAVTGDPLDERYDSCKAKIENRLQSLMEDMDHLSAFRDVVLAAEDNFDQEDVVAMDDSLARKHEQVKRHEVMLNKILRQCQEWKVVMANRESLICQHEVALRKADSDLVLKFAEKQRALRQSFEEHIRLLEQELLDPAPSPPPLEH